MENQDKKKEMPFTKSIVKAELKDMMKKADEDSEANDNFINSLGNLERRVVQGGYLTYEQFHDMCQELLDELETERKDA